MGKFDVCQAVVRAAATLPNKTATIFKDRTRTWAQFFDRVQRFGASLKENGLSARGRVAIVSLNSDRYLEYFYGVPWVNAMVVPINIRLSPAEILFILADCSCEFVLMDDAFKPLIAAVQGKVPSLKKVIFIGEGETPDNCLRYEDMLSSATPCPQIQHESGDTYGIFYTGGTTGSPKGVELTHENIIINAIGMVSVLKYDENTVYGHFAPMFHLADGASTFGVTFACGTHTFVPKFDPVECLECVQNAKVTAALLVPTMMAMMVQNPTAQAGGYNCDSFKVVLYGASPMPESVLYAAMKLFKNSGFVQGYGMTETSPVITLLSQEEHYEGNKRLRSVGRPIYYADVKVVDENDNEVPRGTVGELITAGPHVMKGYWNQADLTANVTKGGYMHTGDGAYMDEEGFVYICDRLKDMVVTGGENVYSAEVENVVMSFPGVAMCACIGTPDEKLVEKVTVVLVPKEGAEVTEEGVIAHCKEKIAGYKCPRMVVIQKEPLPVSGAGKVLKHVIRKPYWENAERKNIYADKETKTAYS